MENVTKYWLTLDHERPVREGSDRRLGRALRPAGLEARPDRIGGRGSEANAVAIPRPMSWSPGIGINVAESGDHASAEQKVQVYFVAPGTLKPSER